MKKVIVKNLADVQTHGAEMTEPQAWVAECVASNAWGLPERWVPAQEDIDPADILESEMREVKPATDDAPAEMQEWVKLRAEYQIEIVDISAEHALRQTLAARKAEYPSPEEFLNAFFDGGDEALEELRQRRLAIKAKYPKE